MFAFAGRSRQPGTAAPRSAASRAARPAAPAREKRPASAGLTARAPLQLRSPVPLSAGAGVVQRQVEHDGTAYKGNDTRPGWRMGAENKLAKDLNAEEGTSYTGSDVNFAKYKKDRGHGVAFDAIQDWVVDYLNSPGAMGLKVLEANVKVLLNKCPSDEQQAALAGVANVAKLINAATPDPSAVVKAANSLLSMLNSVSENLTPTSKYVNTYVGANFHPDFVSSPGGTHISATEHTKAVMDLGEGQINPVLRTPTHEQRVVGIKGGAPLAAMTPDTRQRFDNFKYETRNMKSANVKKQFAPDNPYLSGSTTVTAPSGPKPKINLTPSSTTATAPPSSLVSNNNNAPSSVAVPMATSSTSSTTGGFAPSSATGFTPMMPNPLLAQFQQVSLALQQTVQYIQAYQMHNMQAPPQAYQQYALLHYHWLTLKQALGI